MVLEGPVDLGKEGDWPSFFGTSRVEDGAAANATIEHSDMRGSESHGHDPSGAASD
jgi:hypothetical protein